MRALHRARCGLPNPNAGGYGGELGLVLFGRDMVDAVGPLHGAHELVLSTGDLFLNKITRYLLVT